MTSPRMVLTQSQSVTPQNSGVGITQVDSAISLSADNSIVETVENMAIGALLDHSYATSQLDPEDPNGDLVTINAVEDSSITVTILPPDAEIPISESVREV